MSGEPETLRQLGDFEILSLAGSGGMGVVYKATQRSLGRVVGLKVIREEIASTPEYRDRFLREARLAGSVDHPHVVSVHAVGDHDGKLFLAMQWIDGEDLKRVRSRHGRLAPERAVMIASQLAGALDAVHSIAGLVHRDVKPANVLLRQIGGRDHVYLTDFGVAKPTEAGDRLTQTGLLVGTMGYLSPEQIKGEEPGPQSDLYALGCVLFETLTGKLPFARPNEMALGWAHANDPRPTASGALPGLGDRYDHFFAVALAVDPDQRFRTGREFAEALASAHHGTTQIATVPSPIGPDASTIRAQRPPDAGPPAEPPRQPPAQPPPAQPPTEQQPPAQPPPQHTPGQPPPVYPAYGYVTPVPPYPQPQRSSNPLALALVGLLALAGIAVGALAAAGVFSHNSSTKTITSAVARQTTNGTARQGSKNTNASVSGDATRTCGGDLSVGGTTSCPFGQNVESAYVHGRGGNTDVTAYSPVTHRLYTMNCTGSVPHVCTGGNKALVSFTSSPAPAPSSSAGTTPCDQNISAGPDTSCPFAEKVFVSYFHDYKANGQQSGNTIQATSPVTHQSYTMNCTNDGTNVRCTGGNNAVVTFPFHAILVY